jgi:hypothetical protein
VGLTVVVIVDTDIGGSQVVIGSTLDACGRRIGIKDGFVIGAVGDFGETLAVIGSSDVVGQTHVTLEEGAGWVYNGVSGVGLTVVDGRETELAVGSGMEGGVACLTQGMSGRSRRVSVGRTLIDCENTITRVGSFVEGIVRGTRGA